MHSSQKLLVLGLFTTFLVLMLSSCRLIEEITGSGGVPSPGGTTSTVKDSMSLKVNGIFYKPRVLNSTAVDLFNQRITTGSEPDLAKLVTVTVPKDVAVGKYPLLVASKYVAQYQPTAFGDLLPRLDTGSVTILKHDLKAKLLEAKFSFLAIDQTNPIRQFLITEGYFRITYK